MIVARIQGHPARAHLHGRLAKALSPLPTELRVHGSDPPDPWSGYRACLSDLPSDYSHVLIVQDDALPCRNFAAAVEQIASSHPEVPVCLFLGGMPAETATRARRAMGRQTYVPLGNTSFVPLVSVLWPRRKAEEFLYWARSQKLTRADDGNASKWMRRTKQPFLVTVPSLVQHDDGQPSVKGGRDHRPWAESWRQALFLAEDALDYEW